ncbi:HAD-IA family hydrolase [Streptomyces hainanensis]|uniref:HAD family hydrolase n=1 Tax=Streptomyces hainanensis TaxID=402648 RepID=A0A4R4SIM6_9ACTN|nr:HAD-IA family hydrolase [Streptomyces hainanensis]TDC62169.1 HAD family hydrolase [Streptomyces hainanensis]
MSTVPSAPTVQMTARALLLDMDGTLVDSEAAVERVWRGWAAEMGIDPELVLAISPGRQAHATMADLLPDRPVELNLADGRRLLAQEAADLADIVPIPGAAEFLAAVEALTVPHALVTSADIALATARMGAAGLRMPDIRITAESVSASKPDPEGFLKGAAELGIAPADCVVFEDSPAGIAAARAAGMRVVGIGRLAAPHGPTAHVDTLRAVTVAAGPDRTITLTVGA